MKFIEYLQQPSSVYAFMALILNTQAEGAFDLKDIVEWFRNQNVAVNVHELKQRWRELTELGFAEQVSGDLPVKSIPLHRRVGYVLTEKGDKASEALMEAVNYVKKL